MTIITRLHYAEDEGGDERHFHSKFEKSYKLWLRKSFQRKFIHGTRYIFASKAPSE